MRFNYVAYTKDLAVTRGHVQARTLEDARTEVSRSGHKLLDLKPAWQAPKLEDMLPSLFKVNTSELLRFARRWPASSTAVAICCGRWR